MKGKKIIAAMLVVLLAMTTLCFGDLKEDKVKAAEIENTTTDETDTTKSFLDVKVQLSKNGDMMRFISSVNSLNYSKVGFEVTAKGETKRNETTTVFERIDSKVDGLEYEYGPKVVDTSSKYFVTANMAVEKETNYTVKAYVVSQDGTTKTYGMSRCVAVEDEAVTAPLNLSFASTANLEAGTLLDVKDTETKAIVIDSDEATVHVRVYVDKTALPSATKFVFTAENDTTELGSTIYRNLYTEYDGTADTADTTWYDVYNQEGEKEFVIVTDADMYGFASVVEEKDNLKDKTVYLAADVTLNEGRPVLDTDDVQWKNGDNEVKEDALYNWTPIGSMSKMFAGTFDGQGHTISGIYMNSSVDGSGLFGATSVDSLVRNFGLEDSWLKSTLPNLGSVVGICFGDISDIYSNAFVNSIYVKDNKTEKCGGLIGTIKGINTITDYQSKDYESLVSNCWFDGTVKAGGINCGGIIGNVMQGYLAMSDCLNTGNVISTATGGYAGGLIGGWNTSTNFPVDATLTNCLNASTIDFVLTNTVGSVIGIANGQNGASTLNLCNVYTTSYEGDRSAKTNCLGLGYSNGTVVDGSKSTGVVKDSETGKLVVDELVGFFDDPNTTDKVEGYWVIRPDGVPIPESLCKIIDYKK